MGSQGPRAKYLRRQWEAEAEAYLEDDPPEVEINYSTTSKADYGHPRPYAHQEETPPPGPSSPLSAAPITFWTSHRARIPGTTTPAASTNVFPRSAAFSTPITVALDPPAWPGWKAC
ncbi:uncharacterized protein LOC119578399 isoform X2 [Penaeus monodon]|uniref:uncharacterized protein LOC119578399 isoform X1 n=1 Tax=Penaeus monodon TaxID=6687 RepID=UPI0018A766CD|nr:uncharacterized protein LOC119578399 isoform X1 [Penaeus monodon]XP_037781916.1 uncharacterized protein LOC119578399 isoform X2 [Penaeus monodon]